LTRKQCIDVLGGWEGYRIESAERIASGGSRPEEVRIELKPSLRHAPRCDGCGKIVRSIHDSKLRVIRDLPIFESPTLLLVHRRRVACPRCGPKLESLPWLASYSRVTARLAESVARLCHILPIKQVAAFYGLSWSAVKRIDKEALQAALEPADFRDVELLVMDEFAIQKGHRYATVVVDPRTKRVLWVGRGHTREKVRPFFEALGSDVCRQIRAVAIDMNAAFELEIRMHCPQAEIVYDLYHVVAKYGREVIDRVRVNEANRLRNDRKARRIVKGARWLLLRNRENLARKEDHIRLEELLKANRALFKVYILRDDLKRLWKYRQKKSAKKMWDSWYRRAVRSRIEPLVKFAKRLKPYLPGILAHCKWPLHTSLIEGINNKIKVIKRMAYGFRDDEYFFLKIRAAFPGIR
jgi:transposase